VADRHAVQSCGLSDQRFPLELLWQVGRERGCEPCNDLGVFPDLPGGRGMDFPDWLSAKELRTGGNFRSA
jgi:hypothetical protein